MSALSQTSTNSSSAAIKSLLQPSTSRRLESKKLFGLMDMNPALSALQRLSSCIHLQGTQGSTVCTHTLPQMLLVRRLSFFQSSEFQVVADLVPVSALADGQKTVYEITLSPFYCSARGTLSSWGATSIFDITTLLSMSTIFSQPAENWCIDIPSGAVPHSLEQGARIMNFAGTSRSMSITWSRPAFVGQKVTVECQIVALSPQKALIRADMIGVDGKVVGSALHDVSSMAVKLKSML